ncbi:MAG TPA: hypothetical protein VF161_06180 [Steroidobacteraceae bacterium]
MYHSLLASRTARAILFRSDGTHDLHVNDSSAGMPTPGPDARQAPAGGSPIIRVEYLKEQRPASQILAQLRFGAAGPSIAGAPLTIDVALEPLRPTAATELWLANGPVRTGQLGKVRYAEDGELLFAIVEVDERSAGGIRGAAESAYRAIREFQAQSGFPHLLRMWNYMDAINEGPGDLERYRLFCVGRVAALGSEAAAEAYPAATAIGRKQSTHVLQVFWLASRTPGRAIENPRQVSAYRYPRAHGPVSPTFSRATLTADGSLLISGTASIVGHASQHPGDASEQLEETLRNLSALSAHVEESVGTRQSTELLKVYLRDPAFLEPVAARLRQTHPHSEAIFLAADICRRELLVEIEAVRLGS